MPNLRLNDFIAMFLQKISPYLILWLSPKAVHGGRNEHILQPIRVVDFLIEFVSRRDKLEFGGTDRGRTKGSEVVQDSPSSDAFIHGRVHGYLPVRGHWSDLQQLLTWAIEAARHLNDKQNEAPLIHNLAIVLQNMGDYETVRERYEQSLTINEVLGNKAGMVNSYHNLGVIAQVTGNYEITRQRYKQVMTIDEALGNKAGMANSYGQLANLAKDEGT